MIISFVIASVVLIGLVVALVYPRRRRRAVHISVTLETKALSVVAVQKLAEGNKPWHFKHRRRRMRHEFWMAVSLLGISREDANSYIDERVWK